MAWMHAKLHLTEKGDHADVEPVMLNMVFFILDWHGSELTVGRRQLTLDRLLRQCMDVWVCVCVRMGECALSGR